MRLKMKKNIVRSMKGLIFCSLVLLSYPMVLGQNTYMNDKVSLELLENSDYCLTNCYAKIKICNVGDSVRLTEDNFNVWFENENTVPQNLDYELKEEYQKEYQRPVYEKEDVCELVLNNKTLKEENVCVSRAVIKDYEPYEKTELKAWAVEKEINDCYILKIEGTKGINENVDWKINVMDLVPNWAWWNSSYDVRYNITTSNTVDLGLSVNDTYGLNGTIFWSLFKTGENVGAYYSDSYGWAIANETDEKFWENETDHTGNDVNSLWLDTVAVYHMDELNIVDSAGGDEGGTETGDVAVHSKGCVFGSCLYFDGSGNDGVNINHTDLISLTDADESFSLVHWFNITDDPCNDNNALTIGLKYTMVIMLKTCISDDAQISVHVKDNVGPTFHILKVEDNPVVNQWYMTTLLYDADTDNMTYYINGTMNGVNLTIADFDPSKTEGMTIGSDPGIDDGWFNGTIDEVRFYNRVLDEQEIEWLWENGQNSLTSLATEEEAPTTSSTTTTTPAVTTTSIATTSIPKVDMIEEVTCSGAYLITNRTEWNGTQWLQSTMNATYCEYNCTETLFGSRCNYSTSVNGLITIGIIILILFAFAVVMALIKRMGLT